MRKSENQKRRSKKYEIKVYMSQYLKVGDEWQTVDVSRKFSFKNWDDVQNFIAYLVEGAVGWVKFEVREITEE